MSPEEFNYLLPDELIASKPLESRDASRMLVIDRSKGTIDHKMVTDFPSYLQEGDLAVMNDTKVVAARFFSSDNKKEILRTADLGDGKWRCLVKPGKKLRISDTIEIKNSIGTVIEILKDGERIIQFDTPPDPETDGHLALPPYMLREENLSDRERYQTVYANSEKAESVAAPTAGLHFTQDLLEEIPHTFLTLHVGPGTFRPVKVDNIDDHPMHREEYSIEQDAINQIMEAKRVISIGTTTARVLEHVAKQPSGLVAGNGSTNIFIRPGHEFNAVDALLTNFHLPKSTLLMLVSALAGRDLIMEAYHAAIKEKYRFYSYGDCMLIH